MLHRLHAECVGQRATLVRHDGAQSGRWRQAERGASHRIQTASELCRARGNKRWRSPRRTLSPAVPNESPHCRTPRSMALHRERQARMGRRKRAAALTPVVDARRPSYGRTTTCGEFQDLRSLSRQLNAASTMAFPLVAIAAVEERCTGPGEGRLWRPPGAQARVPMGVLITRCDGSAEVRANVAVVFVCGGDGQRSRCRKLRPVAHVPSQRDSEVELGVFKRRARIEPLAWQAPHAKRVAASGDGGTERAIERHCPAGRGLGRRPSQPLWSS